MPKTFTFVTDCVGSTYELLEPMLETEREITWRTFLSHVPLEEIKMIFPFYSYRQEYRNPDTGEMTVGMHIKDDYAVSFHKSKYDGRPCYFVCHSSIEYIFCEGGR